MTRNKSEIPPVEAPLGELERALIAEFVRARGYDPQKLSDLPQEERQSLLKDASVYASGKLMEIEARSHLLDELHDGVPGIPKTGVD
jgi:hypothetical protein